MLEGMQGNHRIEDILVEYFLQSLKIRFRLSSTVKRMDSKPHSSFTRLLNNLDENTILVPSIQQLKHFGLFTCLQNTLFKVYCNITPLDGFFPGFSSSLQKE